MQIMSFLKQIGPMKRVAHRRVLADQNVVVMTAQKPLAYERILIIIGALRKVLWPISCPWHRVFRSLGSRQQNLTLAACPKGDNHANASCVSYCFVNFR